MNAEPITFTGTLTEQDAVDMTHYRSLCLLRPFFRWLIGVFCALMVVSIAALMLVFGKFSLLLCVFLVLFGYVPIAWWYHHRFSIRRYYRHHPELLIESTATITERDVSLSNRNYDTRINWNQFAFLLDTPRGLLFMVPPMQMLCWLPQRLFEGNSHKETILAYAKQNSVAVKKQN